MKTIRILFFVLLLSFGLSGCVGVIVGAAVDTTIEVAKIPFKVAGAVVDVARGDDDKKEKKRKKDEDE